MNRVQRIVVCVTLIMAGLGAINVENQTVLGVLLMGGGVFVLLGGRKSERGPETAAHRSSDGSSDMK